MEGKVKCSGCGWSWNKSDSSKKDMYVCHQCGKDNVMKNGGWLNKYDDGGPVQPNYNDASVSMSDDFVGLGYDTNGRNYSPAWGGQFQGGGKLNPISPMQQVQQAVEPTPTVPYLQTKDPAEFYKSWIQNPEYERRLKATGYSDVPNKQRVDKLSQIEEVKKERLGLLENIQPIEYDPSKRSEAIIDYYDGSTINVNPSDYKTFSKQSVEAHEIAHVATPTSTMSNDEFGIFMGSIVPSKKPIVSGVQGSKEREASIEAVGDFEHLIKPWEAKADLDALRFMMYDKGIYDITKGKKFTETDFEKVKQSFGKERVFKRFTDKMGKENFVKLMNTIALADDQEEAPIAMGGMSIPGSVGFSYARVAGAAPSKGKYAKKTMASAQNGIMSPMLLARNVLNYFYPSEEAAPSVSVAPVEYKKGLTNELLQRQAYKESTFNPAAVSPAGYKGIAQIGEGVLKDYSNKKGGKKLDPFNPEDAVELQKFAMDDLYNASFINKPNQPDSVRIAKTLAAYNWGRGNLSNYLNEQKSKGVDIYDSYDWLNNLPKETSDYVNKILLQEDPSFNKNYKKASTNPKYEEVTSLYDQKKFGGDIPSAQNGQEMRFYQNGLDWKPKSMQEGGDIIYAQEGIRAPYRLPEYQQKFANYDVSKSRPNDPEDSFSGKQKKFIAEEISDPITTRVLNVLNDIKPLNNVDIYNTIRPIEYPNVFKLPRLAYNYVMGNETEPLKTKDGKPHIAEEFWATALNIPGEKEYLKESQYKPSKSKDPNAKYYTIRDIIDERDLMNLTKNLKPGEKMKMNGLSPILDSEWYSENAKTDNNISFEDLDPLQRFTLQRSDDGSYISIYDKYDFDNPALNRMLNSFEIYDRFYIDKEDNKQSKLLPSSPKKKKDGGIIKDNQGYWNSDNWGKPVEIDSNDITMEGVNQPLLGVSDTGDTKLMKPGKNYKFKGKKVTEYPVAKLGINQLDAQPMKKLNQLLNFTNNPDKDNWLDKYN